MHFFTNLFRIDSSKFYQIRGRLGLTCGFHQFLTMLIKLFDSSIKEAQVNKILMVMNVDATSTLKFLRILEFKNLIQLQLPMKMGDIDLITDHV